jgi:hypothetical protein
LRHTARGIGPQLKNGMMAASAATFTVAQIIAVLGQEETAGWSPSLSGECAISEELSLGKSSSLVQRSTKFVRLSFTGKTWFAWARKTSGTNASA